MKLRRALAAAATTAVIAPIALLSAPTAFATTDDPTSAPTETVTDAPTDTPTEDATTPATEEPTPTEDATTPATEEPTPTEDATTPATEEPTPTEEPTTSASPSPSESAPSDDDESWNPYEDCETFDLDDNLQAEISGLPSKIVAGSGWHNFEFVATNNSDKDLENVWIEALTEYADEVNDESSLYLDLAEIQVKEDGKWTSSYQDFYKDEDGKTVFTGSFVASLDKLEANSSASLDLRVRVKSSAPAGASFALSQAIYAGEDAACYGNGEFYEFTVLAAGSNPGNPGPAKPNGEKPGIDGNKPQGEVEEITGNLAETGSSSNLPIIATVGGVAILAGAGVVFAMKRRKVGAEA